MTLEDIGNHFGFSKGWLGQSTSNHRKLILKEYGKINITTVTEHLQRNSNLVAMFHGIIDHKLYTIREITNIVYGPGVSVQNGYNFRDRVLYCITRENAFLEIRTYNNLVKIETALRAKQKLISEILD